MNTNEEKIERALECIFCDTLDADYTYKDGAFYGEVDDCEFEGRIITVEEDFWFSTLEYESDGQLKEQCSLEELFNSIVFQAEKLK